MEHTKNEVVIDQPRAVAQQSSGAVTPAELLRYALDSGADLDRLEKLMDLQERHEANQARKAFADDMARFKEHPITIIKDKTVDYGEGAKRTIYDHATIGNVVEKIVPALAQYGFSHRWDLEQNNGQVIVTCVITHKLGHSQSTTLMAAPDASGGKNGIQSVISAKTYLERHTLLAATGLATKDQEDDDAVRAEMQQMAADMRAPQPKRKIGEKGFAAALAAIKAGTYTLAEIEDANELTDEQRIAAIAAAAESTKEQGPA